MYLFFKNSLTLNYAIYAASCVEEVFAVMEPSGCHDRVPDQMDVPVYVCSNDEEGSRVIVLQCCSDPIPCVGWAELS